MQGDVYRGCETDLVHPLLGKMKKSALPGRRYVPANANTSVTLLSTWNSSGVAAAKMKITAADKRCEIDACVTWRDRKGRGIVGVLTRTWGRVNTTVEACRIARSGLGNVLALSCTEDLFY